MANYQQIFDAQTIGTNSTVTSNAVNVQDVDSLNVQLVGDTNSTDINIELEGKTAPQAPQGEYENTLTSNEDLTASTNNSKIYAYDVEGLNTAYVKITNNDGTNTTDLDAYTAKGSHE